MDSEPQLGYVTNQKEENLSFQQLNIAKNAEPAKSSGVERFLTIVKRKLEREMQPRQAAVDSATTETNQPQEKRQKTAKALLDLLNGSDTIESFTLIQEEIQTTEQPQEGQSQEQQDQQPQIITKKINYQHARIITKDDSAKVVEAFDENNNKIEIPLADFARMLARGLDLPDHQIKIIEAHIANQPVENIADVARNFGFLTQEDLYRILDIPQNQQEREKIIKDPNIPPWRKDLMAKLGSTIDSISPIPQQEEIVSVIEATEIPTDKPLKQAIKKIEEYLPNLPSEQQVAFRQLIENATQQLDENQTLAQAIREHYQKLNNGEEIDYKDTENMLKNLLNIEKYSEYISDEKKREIINKAKNIGKWAGIAITLISLLLIWKSAQSNRQQQGGMFG
jgi:hypothetical protein